MERIAITRADYGPTQEIFPQAEGGFCVTAETPDGVVWIHQRDDLDEADARHLCRAIERAKTINPAHWGRWRTIFGSEAWSVEEGEAYDAAQLIRRGLAGEEDFYGTPVGQLL